MFYNYQRFSFTCTYDIFRIHAQQVLFSNMRQLKLKHELTMNTRFQLAHIHVFRNLLNSLESCQFLVPWQNASACDF